MEITSVQAERVSDVPAVSIEVADDQLKKLVDEYTVLSSGHVPAICALDCRLYSYDACSKIGEIIDMNPEEFAGQLVVLSPRSQ